MPKRLIQAIWSGPVLLQPEPGIAYADDHPLVVQHPDWFADIVIIEQATAAPGERRQTVRR